MHSQQELAAIISQFYCGEKEGASLVWQLPAIAPGIGEKKFCEQWAKDEEKHEQLFQAIAGKYPIGKLALNNLFQGIYEIAHHCVEQKDWIKCITIANFIEHLAAAAGEYLLEQGDERVKAVVTKVLIDEKKHLAFSQQQLQRYLCYPKNKAKTAAVLEQLFLLSLRLGKAKQFGKHDLLISNKAQQRFLLQLEKLSVSFPQFENKNGYLRNRFYELTSRTLLTK